MIRVEDLTVSLGDHEVLADVSMAVDDGEFVGLVGPNGAGKTTLLRCLSGVLSPDSGVVTVDGDPVVGLGARESSRRIAIVPQDTTLAFDFSVRDVVDMGRTPHRGRFERASVEDRDAVDRAMARTDVARFADDSIQAVSGGERQRVVLARALAQEAPVLLLDEPTASLDVNHQIRTLDLVADLVDDGRTAVAAIHDLSLAARYCDRLVLLADGGVLAAGPPERVLERTTVADAFDADAAVVDDPVTGTPAVTPLSDPGWTLDAHVHVAGTGADAGRVVTTLAAAGATVTAGPVPEGDAVATAASGVDAPVVTVPAFEGVDDASRRAVVEHATAADVALAAGTVPDAALRALPDGTRLLVTPDAILPHDDASRLGDDDASTDLERVAIEDLGAGIADDRVIVVDDIRDRLSTVADGPERTGSYDRTRRDE
ncbi:heme ABC transporter ATP-binding protein [Halorubellus sp. JP-L1]|uniref:heme ABC transporter ATP-binding protein n=1 Tax=Halorubellus sp. JP-L1 TaxID=2715753 RepID=UPI00140E8A72|nr:heme ABC transporter ATP-binding protein [Halorubellus sp. JP-L1]NHN40344.1 heme ABC transporter ATP-binding protein [Halorubellus sp. JP-L1]